MRKQLGFGCATIKNLALSILPLALVAFGTLSADTRADEEAEETIVRVEEDWGFRVNCPDLKKTAPQVFTLISPTQSTENLHAIFELNHVTLPKFDAGGMQIQCWKGDSELTYRQHPNANILSNNDETVTFTMSMQLSNGSLAFEVKDGSSTSWGTFGGQGYLKTSSDTTLSSLNDYSPDISVKNSRIGYGSNKVDWFILKEVRYYSADGLVKTDSTERIVHKSDSSE